MKNNSAAYMQRNLTSEFHKMFDFDPVVTLLGPKQSGKRYVLCFFIVRLESLLKDVRV